MMSETTNSTAVWAILVIAFNPLTQWRSRGGGGEWGHAPRGAHLGSASTHLIQPFKIAVKTEI